MSDDWHKLSVKVVKKPGRKPRQSAPKTSARLRKGLRTSEEKLKIPLLKTLIKMGGSGQVSEILGRMEPLVKGVLTEHDYEIFPSVNEARWRNTAKWARAPWARRNCLTDTHLNGTWTISLDGRKWLKDQTEYI